MMFQVLPGPFEEILAVLEYWDHIFSGFLLTLCIFVQDIMRNTEKILFNQ